MDTIVLKFGGSSVADNEKLQTVANKIIKIYEEENNVVVVVSAQGKTTDSLVKQAEELSLHPDKREMDVLLSVGEQITTAKLSILLNYLGYKSNFLIMDSEDTLSVIKKTRRANPSLFTFKLFRI